MAQPYLGNTSWLRSRSASVANTPIFKASTFKKWSKTPFPAKDAYGYLVFTQTVRQYGLFKFSTNDLLDLNLVNSFDGDTIATAGEVVDGVYYSFYSYSNGMSITPIGLRSYNLNTGAKHIISNPKTSTTAFFSDMAYDYSTKVMYAIGQNNATQRTSLKKVNLSDGKVTELGDFPETKPLRSLACTYDGQLYGVNFDGNLCKVDKTNGVCTIVGQTGLLPQYIQSMTFDHSDETLYWAANDRAGRGYFCIIDLSTGRATYVDDISDSGEMTGLYIPFKLKDGKVPAKITDFVVTAAAQGASQATMTFTVPSKSKDGAGSASVSSIKLYRDNDLVKTFDAPVAGQQMTYTDAVTTGYDYHFYRIVAVNSVGESLPATYTLFVGKDVPNAPTNAKLTNVNGKLHLTWTAPVVGINGGYINPSAVTYSVVRYPDDVTVATGLNTTEFTDNGVTTLKAYSYGVKSITTEGTSDEVRSDTLVYGEAFTVPYTCTFKNQEDFATWTVIDQNKDGLTWTYNGRFGDGVYSAECLSFDGQAAKNTDDWLVSPAIKLAKGKSYSIEFDARSFGTEQGQTITDSLVLAYGKDGTTPDNMIVLKKMTISTFGFVHYIASFTAAEAGNYKIAFHSINKDKTGYVVSVGNVDVNENRFGSIDGTITSGGKPVKGVKLSIDDTWKQTAVTDANGKYSFEHIDAGSYTLSTSLLGYYDYSVKVAVTTLNQTHQNIVLQAIPQYKLAGKVTDAVGTPIKDVSISVRGYNSYDTKSAADGTFSISGIYKANDYRVILLGDKLVQLSDTMNITSDVTKTYVLKDMPLSPLTVTAAESNGQSVVTWSKESADSKEFRWDDNHVSSQVGLNDPTGKLTDYAAVGTIYRTPTLLTSMSWLQTTETGPHNFINIFVLALDADGNLTNKILFSKMKVPTKEMFLNTYVFPEPINCPNGFGIAVSEPNGGYVAVGIDYGGTMDYENVWPFQKRTNFFSGDISKANNYTFFEDAKITKSPILRANGVPTSGTIAPEAAKAPASLSAEENSVKLVSRSFSMPVKEAALVKAQMQKTPREANAQYNVWRFKSGNEASNNTWVLLNSTPTSDLSLTDNLWSGLSYGVYRYAVQTVYPGTNKSSNVSLSNVLPNNMYVKVTVPVVTKGTASNYAEGAIVTLFSNHDTIVGKVDASFKAVFPKVWRNVYKIRVERAGFNIVEQTGFDFRTKSEYTTKEFELIENKVAPFNLKANKTENDHERLLVWNKSESIFDDFEGHTSFAVNSAGQVGWTYIDGDNLYTLGFDQSQYSFKNNSAKMAYMIFSPTETKPAMTYDQQSTPKPHSGNKELADFIASGGVNNDYIISPALGFNEDFIIDFYAKSYISYYGLEHFNVGYSTTGSNPADFIYLSDTTLIAPADAWKEYKFTVPSTARYVTIHCTSPAGWIFLVDDIFIGKQSDFESRNKLPQKEAYQTSYEVTLDGKVLGTTKDTQYLLSNLADGLHTAGVTAIYETGKSATTQLEFGVNVGIEDVSDTPTINYYRETGMITFSQSIRSFSIYDTAGAVMKTSVVHLDSYKAKDLVPGIYVVKGYDMNGQSVTKKISVK